MSSQQRSGAGFWLLDPVATAEFPPDALADEGRAVNTLNRRWHGLARGELLDALCRLFERGRPAARRPFGAAFTPTREEVSEALGFTPVRGRGGDSAREVYHLLTPARGALWESHLKPWRATYWKTLAGGYRVRYQHTPAATRTSRRPHACASGASKQAASTRLSRRPGRRTNCLGLARKHTARKAKVDIQPRPRPKGVDNLHA